MMNYARKSCNSKRIKKWYLACTKNGAQNQTVIPFVRYLLNTWLEKLVVLNAKGNFAPNVPKIGLNIPKKGAKELFNHPYQEINQKKKPNLAHFVGYLFKDVVVATKCIVNFAIQSFAGFA